MKGKNGFTLVEVLAVLSVIGVLVIILVGPNVMKYFNVAKTELSKQEKKDFLDAAKTYAVILKEGGSHSTIGPDGNKIVTKATYNNGIEEISGYDFISYVAQNGMDVTAEYLVKNGYYNEACDYDTENNKCLINKECKVHITFDYTTVKANPSCNLDDDGNENTKCTIYYSLGNMSAEIANENECSLK